MGGPRHRPLAIGPELRDVVASAVTLEAPADAATRCPVFPDPSVLLLFGGGTWHTAEGPVIEGGGLRVLGVLTRRWEFRMEPGAWLIALSLRPGAARGVLGVPARELTGGLLALDELWGSRARRLESALEDAGSASAAADHLLGELAARRGSDARPGWIQALEAGGGRTTVDELARVGGVTRQQLRRQAHRDLGVGPKLASRLTRFQFALELAASGRKQDWSDVAARLGYFDQAHLIAEFREFTGTSPTQLA